MPDPIRASLEAAQKQASSFYSLPETAAIIAAFLRAMEDDGQGPWVLPDDRHALAAAIETAAKDA